MSSRQPSRVSTKTIEIVKESGNVTEQFVQYLINTKDSNDPRDLVVHRPIIKTYNPTDPNRVTNNTTMHEADKWYPRK